MLARPHRREVTTILPGGVDDPAAPSGGNRYDLRAVAQLMAGGRAVRRVDVAGGWPRPDRAALDALAGALAAVPDGAPVLADGLVACAAPEVMVPATARLRVVVLVHLPLAAETGLPPADAVAMDARERRVLHAAAAVVATSERARAELTARHGLPLPKVHVAAPGVDRASVVRSAAAGTRLLCVASVTPRKGHDVLVEALARVADLPWTCDLVGATDRDPPFAALVDALVQRHGLAGRVRWLGPQAGDTLAASYAASDLLVLASHAETYGMVVTEALARGLPVLATDVGGVPEALSGRPEGADRADPRLPGLLVPPADPPALAGALRRWLTEPGLRDRLRAAAGARRDTLAGWDVTARCLAAVLDGAA